MSQLRLGHAGLRARETEVVVVTPTPVEKGAQYDQLFKFVHPYLCDPGYVAAEQFGLPIRRGAVLQGLVGGMVAPGFWHEVIHVPPEVNKPLPAVAVGAMRGGHVDAFFLVDKQGIVRQGRTGFGMGVLPSMPELLRMVEELPADPGPTDGRG